MMAQLMSFEEDVQPGLLYLAAAALIHWNEIPEELRQKIVDTAKTGAVGGLPPTTSLNEQINRLLRYTKKIKGAEAP